MSMYINSFRRRLSRESNTTHDSKEKEELSKEREEVTQNNQEKQVKETVSDRQSNAKGNGSKNDYHNDEITSNLPTPSIPSTSSNEETQKKTSVSKASSGDAEVPKKSKMSVYVNSFQRRFSRDKAPDSVSIANESSLDSVSRESKKEVTQSENIKSEDLEKKVTSSSSSTSSDKKEQKEEEDSHRQNEVSDLERKIKKLTTSCFEYTDIMNKTESELSSFLSNINADECKKWVKLHRNPMANETEISKPKTVTAIPIGNISIPLAPAPKKSNSQTKRDLSQTHYRLVLFSWAGGNSSGYRGFAVPGCDLITIELPARLGRLKEEPVTDVRKLVVILGDVLDKLGYFRPSSPPLLIMGHSFGSLCATEFCFYLRHKGPQYIGRVKGLIVSGCSPLHLRNESKYHEMAISSKNDDDLIDYLVGMGGTQKEVAANKNIMKLVLPALRADYAAVETYHYLPQDPLPFKIFALTGDQDDRIELDVMPHWKDFTSDKFEIKWYPGGHFYLKSIYEEISKDIVNEMVI